MVTSAKRLKDVEATRRAIVKAATRCFGKKGFAATGLADVARAAGVTTGAIYHHFADKKALFKVVAEGVEEEVADRVSKLAGTGDPWSDLLESMAFALTVCMTPHIRQIAFVDAANVIGSAEWREIQSRYGLGILVATLEELQRTGIIRAVDPQLAGRVLLAALIEAAEACALAADGEAMRRDAQRLLTLLVSSLREGKD